MEHAEFDAKVAEALHRSGRELQAFCAGWFDWHSVPPHSYEKWRLADPAPLTDEQAIAAAKAGACVVEAMDPHENVFRFAAEWEVWAESEWVRAGAGAPGNGLYGDTWQIVPDPSRAAEDEPVTFGIKAGQAAWDAGASRNLQGSWEGATWFDCCRRPAEACDHGDCEHYRLAPGYQPTAEQVAAIVKAEPERLCAGGPLRMFGWIGGSWSRWSGSCWDVCSTGHDAYPGGQSADTFVLCIRPDYKPAEATEPQDTLLACMRWCDDRDQKALLRRAGCTLHFGKIETDGELALEPYAALGLKDFTRPMELSTDNGATWFRPTRGLPEVEPKSGADLRWWLHDTGRKARGMGGMADCRYWFDREACCFMVDWNGDGHPKRAHWPDPEQGMPATGTWESE